MSDETEVLDRVLCKRGLSLTGDAIIKRGRLLEDVLREERVVSQTSGGPDPQQPEDASDDVTAAEAAAPAKKARSMTPKRPLQDRSFRAKDLHPHMLRLAKKPIDDWTESEVAPIFDIENGCTHMDGSGDSAEAAQFVAHTFSAMWAEYARWHPDVAERMGPSYLMPLFDAASQPAVPEEYTARLQDYYATRTVGAPASVQGSPMLRVVPSNHQAVFFGGYMLHATCYRGHGGCVGHIKLQTQAAHDVVKL